MDQTIVGGLVVAILVICQFAKTLRFVESRYIPVISIALGILGAYLVGGVTWAQTAGGVIMGLSASGLYSGFKAAILNR